MLFSIYIYLKFNADDLLRLIQTPHHVEFTQTLRAADSKILMIQSTKEFILLVNTIHGHIFNK